MERQMMQTMASDQAAVLRALVRGKPTRARVIAVTSGKGGVGKTNLAVNLGILLARHVGRVVLVDADLGLANVDILLDVRPRYSLEHVLRGERDIYEVLLHIQDGFHIVPGASGISDMANMQDRNRACLLRNLALLEQYAEIILIDTGAGIARNVIQFASAADEVLVVATPEPTAIADAYAVIKLISREDDFPAIKLVTNMARSRHEGDKVNQRIASVARRFLNVTVAQSGSIAMDPKIIQAVRRKRAVAVAYPHCAASQCLKRLARALVLDADTTARLDQGFVSRIKTLFSSRKTA